MSLEGKNIGILVEDLYEDLELWYPYYRLREAQADVQLIAPKVDKQYNSKHGYPVQPTLDVKKALTRKFDGLIIPGGYSPDLMRRTKEMVDIVAKAVNEDCVVGAICHGPWMLTSADVIRGRRCTSFFSIKDDLIHAGGLWIDKEVVQDGNIITSRRPDDLPAFMSTFMEVLSGSLLAMSR
jgi:protease I